MPPTHREFSPESLEKYEDKLNSIYNNPYFQNAVIALGIDPVSEPEITELLFLIAVSVAANPRRGVWDRKSIREHPKAEELHERFPRRPTYSPVSSWAQTIYLWVRSEIGIRWLATREDTLLQALEEILRQRSDIALQVES